MKISLKAARVNRNLKIDEAARMLGVSAVTLINYEDGTTFPNVPMIYKIEDVYKINFADIDFLRSRARVAQKIADKTIPYNPKKETP